MAEDVPTATNAAPAPSGAADSSEAELTQAQQIKAYYDVAPDRRKMGDLCRKYPYLAQTFSGANHD